MDLKAYSNELEKVNNKVKQLKAENEATAKQVKELEVKYEKAVSSMNDDQADKLHKKIYDLKQQIDNRKNKIIILQDKNNPNLRKAATETIKAYYVEREKQLQEADKLIKELERVREQYFDLCGQLKEINDEHSRTKARASRANKTADHSQLPQQAKGMLLGNSQLVNFSEFEILLQDIHQYIYKAVQ